VHADIAAGYSWSAFTAGLQRADTRVLEDALWGRQRAVGELTSGVAGIARVVCGHTIMPDCRVHRVANVWQIDTGAGLGADSDGCLTVLSLERLFREEAPLVTVRDTGQ
jgi:serine/threonine protein phosphatase 1